MLKKVSKFLPAELRERGALTPQGILAFFYILNNDYILAQEILCEGNYANILII